jgi:hypothetical protein
VTIIKSKQENTKQSSKWIEAANDAKAKIAELKKSANYYLEMNRKGEPWPGEQQKSPQEGGQG